MPTRQIVIRFHAPIPVGHRVEIAMLERNLGLFGDDWHLQAGQARLTDHDTGIVYAPLWYPASDLRRTMALADPRPGPAVREAKILAGTVQACRIYLDTEGKMDSIFTVLDIET